MSETHVHDCSGPDRTCVCGWVFYVPPISVSYTVYDKSRIVVDDGYNCETLEGAILGLERAIQKLKAVARERDQ